MKAGWGLMILLACILGGVLPHAEAQNERNAYCGSVYPHFQVAEDDKVFFNAYENYGDPFRSKRVLYCISLNDMTVENVFSVRNASSNVFEGSGMVFFTYPDSWISNHLTYGSHTWYSSSISDTASKKNWNKLCENNSKVECRTKYFDTIDGVFRYTHSGQEYGHCELSKFEGGHYTNLLSLDNAKLTYGHSFVIIQTQDQQATQILKIYDISGKRTLEIPYTEGWLPEIIVSGNRLYYNAKYKVLCYDIVSGQVEEIYSSAADQFMSLCCDDDNLYIIEKGTDGKMIIQVLKASNGMHVEEVVIQHNVSGCEYIVVDGVLLCGNTFISEVIAYDFDSETIDHISIN